MVSLVNWDEMCNVQFDLSTTSESDEDDSFAARTQESCLHLWKCILVVFHECQVYFVLYFFLCMLVSIVWVNYCSCTANAVNVCCCHKVVICVFYTACKMILKKVLLQNYLASLTLNTKMSLLFPKEITFNVKVVRADMNKLPNEKVEFEWLEWTHKILDDCNSNVNAVTNAIQSKMGNWFLCCYWRWPGNRWQFRHSG